MAVEKYKDPATGEWVATRAPVSKGAPKIHASQHAIDGTDPLTPEMIGATSMKLLWENASPASEFAAQTLGITGVGTYPFYDVEIGVPNYGRSAVFRVRNGAGLWANGVRADTNEMFVRVLVFGDGVINFDNATLCKSDSTSATAVANKAMVPLRIYGIKGVTE